MTQVEITKQIAENKEKINKGIEKLKEIRARLEEENRIGKEKYAKYLD